MLVSFHYLVIALSIPAELLYYYYDLPMHTMSLPSYTLIATILYIIYFFISNYVNVPSPSNFFYFIMSILIFLPDNYYTNLVTDPSNTRIIRTNLTVICIITCLGEVEPIVCILGFWMPLLLLLLYIRVCLY